MSQLSWWQRLTGFDRRISTRIRRFVWRYLTPLIAALVIVSAGGDIGPAWRAHEGAGTRGMVTVTQKDCGRSCSYTGNFVSDDGKDRRTGVGLASGFSDLAVGDRVAALDDGASTDVYPPGGGEDWILTTLFLVGAIGALLLWIYVVPIGALKRRRSGDHIEPRNGSMSVEGLEMQTPIRAVAAGTQDGARFAVVRLREGYDIAEVDAFVTRVAAGNVSSADARSARFTPVRVRLGYDMGEVDDYIDGIAAQLSAAGR